MAGIAPQRSRPCRRPAIRPAALVLLAALLAAPATARAHGEPAALAFWGDFGLPLARCQREIGRAGASCGLNAWRVRRDCRLAELTGAGCDAAAADAAVEAARREAIARLTPVCTDQQIRQLRFLDVREAQTDVIRFCRNVETAAVSAVFLPLPAAPQTLPPAARACVTAVARSATKLLGVAFKARERVLDRIAQRGFAPLRKRALVDSSTAAIAAAAAALEQVQAGSCRSEEVRDLYGRDAATLLGLLASRADCLAGDTYAQAAVVCPPAVCGNGMREPGEDCDDGNQDGGDACPPSCLRM